VQPYFVCDGNICALLAAKDHVNVFLYDGGIVPDPEGILTAGHDNKTARTFAFREGETINEPALMAMFRQIVANNRAGGWRKIKTASGDTCRVGYPHRARDVVAPHLGRRTEPGLAFLPIVACGRPHRCEGDSRIHAIAKRERRPSAALGGALWARAVVEPEEQGPFDELQCRPGEGFAARDAPCLGVAQDPPGAEAGSAHHGGGDQGAEHCIYPFYSRPQWK
jgi:hypothetical protein